MNTALDLLRNNVASQWPGYWNFARLSIFAALLVVFFASLLVVVFSLIAGRGVRLVSKSSSKKDSREPGNDEQDQDVNVTDEPDMATRKPNNLRAATGSKTVHDPPSSSSSGSDRNSNSNSARARSDSKARSPSSSPIKSRDTTTTSTTSTSTGKKSNVTSSSNDRSRSPHTNTSQKGSDHTTNSTERRSLSAKKGSSGRESLGPVERLLAEAADTIVKGRGGRRVLRSNITTATSSAKKSKKS